MNIQACNTNIGRSRSSARRLAVVGTVAAASLALAACSSSSSDDKQAGSSSKLDTITWINPAPGVEAWKNVEKCLKAQAKKQGVKVKVVGSSGSSQDSRQTLNLVEQAVAEGTDAISVLTAGGEAVLETALQQARDKDILVGTMESGSSTKARNFDVGLDIPKFAQDVAKHIGTLDGPKNVGVLSVGLTGTPKVFNTTLEEGLKEVPDAKLVDIVTDNGDVTKDADLVGDLLTAHPEINIIVTNAPGMMAGVETAIRERGALGKVSALAVSFDPTTRAALESGASSGVYIQRLCDVATKTVDSFVAVAAGEDVPKDVPVEAQFATKDDYKSFDENWS